MTEEITEGHTTDWRARLARWVYDRPDVWQLDFLTQGGLASFADDRGIKVLSQQVITLWRAGVLHADYILSDRHVDIPGLLELGDDPLGRFRYLDGRAFSTPETVSRPFDASNVLPAGLDLYFHPFRLYTLFKLLRAGAWMIGAKAWEGAGEWDFASSLAMAAEPQVVPTILGRMTYSGFGDFDELHRLVAEHWGEAQQWYHQLGMDRIEEIRQSVCIAAESLDPNKDVHTLLRLAQGDMILKTRGALGGAVTLLMMAEVLRRATEEVFRVQLPEEDEKGFGIVFRDAKQGLYGSVRVLDSHSARNEFIRSLGLASGPRLRWYVEGDTEYHALISLVGAEPGIDVVNLHGAVVQRGGKGVSFRESLESDLRTEVFSFVSLDGDVDDNWRAVRKAAADDKMCGLFFVSRPDFEFENFAPEELEEVLWEIAVEGGANPEARGALHRTIQGAQTAKVLLREAGRAMPELQGVDKGRDWGERLIRYASEHPQSRKQDCVGQTKPIVEAVTSALRALFVSYRMHRDEWRVDPESGKMVERQKSGSGRQELTHNPN